MVAHVLQIHSLVHGEIQATDGGRGLCARGSAQEEDTRVSKRATSHANADVVAIAVVLECSKAS